MRAWFLLALVPAVALADASTPAKRAPPVTAAVGDRAVTIAWGDDGLVHVRVAGGGELVLTPAGRGYVAEDLVGFHVELASSVAPVPLLKISSRPEACSDYWDIYVSVVDGVPRQALELYGMADPPTMQTPSVKFARDGTAVVTTRTEEDEKHVRITRTRYRFDGRVFVDVSKRAGTRSK